MPDVDPNYGKWIEVHIARRHPEVCKTASWNVGIDREPSQHEYNIMRDSFDAGYVKGHSFRRG